MFFPFWTSVSPYEQRPSWLLKPCPLSLSGLSWFWWKWGVGVGAGAVVMPLLNRANPSPSPPDLEDQKRLDNIAPQRPALTGYPTSSPC
jgi:hypothetical protein